MKDYDLVLNQNGEAFIDVVGNFIAVVEADAPDTRFRIIGIDSNGSSIVSINMAVGGVLRNSEKFFEHIRVSNPAYGSTRVKIVAGVGDYEEGSSGSGGGGTSPTDALAYVAGSLASGETFTIPNNDSRKEIIIQNTGEFPLTVNGIILTPYSVFERPIKSSLEIGTLDNQIAEYVYYEEI